MTVLLPSWKLVHLDHTSAKTTIRLWHELHKANNVAHDFSDLLSPNMRDHSFMASVMHDEIRAICQLGRDNLADSRMKRIAHPPNGEHGGHVLVILVAQAGVAVDWKSMKMQPRWMITCSYYIEKNGTNLGKDDRLLT